MSSQKTIICQNYGTHDKRELQMLESITLENIELNAQSIEQRA